MIENRTAAATRARMRASEEKAAARLRERGWTVTPPAPGELAGMRCLSCKKELRWNQRNCPQCGDRVDMPADDKELRQASA